jgi:outer membrane protein assembly factor BamB
MGSDDKNVYALNASTGKVVWNYTTGGFVIGSVAVDDSRVYVGTWDAGNFYALNSSTGAELWDAKISHVRTTPAIDNGIVYVSSDDFYLHAFNASTGALLWKYLTVSPGDTYAQYNGMFASPAVAEGRVYIGTNEGNILAFGNQSTLPPPQILRASNIFLIVLGLLVALVVVATVVVLLLKKRLAVKTTL